MLLHPDNVGKNGVCGEKKFDLYPQTGGGGTLITDGFHKKVFDTLPFIVLVIQTNHETKPNQTSELQQAGWQAVWDGTSLFQGPSHAAAASASRPLSVAHSTPHCSQASVMIITLDRKL